MICIKFQTQIYIDVSFFSEVKKIVGLSFSKLSFKVNLQYCVLSNDKLCPCSIASYFLAAC